MPDTIVVAVLSLIGTLAGSFGGAQLIKYRIEQLEKKVVEPDGLRRWSLGYCPHRQKSGVKYNQPTEKNCKVY